MVSQLLDHLSVTLIGLFITLILKDGSSAGLLLVVSVWCLSGATFQASTGLPSRKVLTMKIS